MRSQQSAIQYDAAGNMTFDGSNTFTYGDHGRMSTLVNTAGTLTYSYNALGQRVAKSGPATMVPTGAAYYVYDQGGHLLGEYDANASPLYESIYLDSTDNAPPVGVTNLSGSAASSTLTAIVYNVYSDQINTPRVITRQSDEAIVWRWDSAEAFGASAPDQNPNALGTFIFNQRFPGQVFDAESGLSQNWNREYNARTGRYIQSDPIGLGGGINTFAYVEANPVSAIDPMGLVIIILVPPGDPTYPAAVAHADDPNVCIVISHGSPTGVNQMNASKLAAYLKAHGCKSTQPILLDSCSTGQGNNSIAEQLAKLWDAPVRAPTDRIWNVGSWENPVPYAAFSEDLRSNWNRVPNPIRPGYWRIFNKNGPIPEPNGSDAGSCSCPLN